MKKEILFVDPRKILNNIIIKEFRSKGYNLTSSFSVFDAQEIVKKKCFDLIIIDSFDSTFDSLSSLKTLRRTYDGLVFLIKDKLDKDDIEKCKELMVSDILTNPFDVSFAISKINKLFYKDNKSKDEKPFDKSFDLDINKNTLYINNKEVKTTKTDFELLKYLYNNLERVSLKDDLFAFFNENDNKRIVDQYIKRIRKILINTKYEIKTIYGVGYIMQIKK